jgi:hypothetical protein
MSEPVDNTRPIQATANIDFFMLVFSLGEAPWNF